MKRLILLLLFMLIMVGLFTMVVGADTINIGVIQIVEHPALDASAQGFVDALNEEGYQKDIEVEYQFQNAQGDMSTANTIARMFVDEGMDLVLAIATPTSQAMAQATDEIPILITAVTDPVAAELVAAMDHPETNVTGTTDLTPVKTQLELLLTILPEAERVGVLYNVGEVNSVVQVDIAKEAADELGLELVEATVSTSAEVLQSAQSLVGRVDAMYVPTDNTVVSALESVVMVAEDERIPLIVGEEDSVERGGLATTGINYYELGFQTGKMAVQVIEGADPSTMPIQSADRVETVINISAAEAMGIQLCPDLLEAADRIIE